MRKEKRKKKKGNQKETVIDGIVRSLHSFPVRSRDATHFPHSVFASTSSLRNTRGGKRKKKKGKKEEGGGRKKKKRTRFPRGKENSRTGARQSELIYSDPYHRKETKEEKGKGKGRPRSVPHPKTKCTSYAFLSLSPQRCWGGRGRKKKDEI